MAKRRGNGEGSIYRLPDGRWRGQITVGYDPATGKRKRKSFYGQTRKEVAEKIAQTQTEIKNGTFVEPTKTTLGEWLDKWLTSYKKGQLKQGTYEGYESIINVHIKPALGEMPMAKLQANTIQDFYNSKLESGLANKTVKHMHVVIRQALQQAVKEGLLNRNVADATSPPTIKSKQMRPLTEEELLTFFEEAKEDRLYAAFLLAATTGLRRGELLGLCWDCVDLDGGVITVKRQLLSLRKKIVLEESVKSKAGKRSVVLTDDAIRELKTHRKRQAQEKLLMGEAYQDNGLVFCQPDGTFLRPEEFTKRFQRYLKKAGLPKVRLHDLRHTHASLLLARGVHPKVVQERLGHSSITMTLDLYSHMVPGLQEAAARSLDGLLNKEKGPAKTQGHSQKR